MFNNITYPEFYANNILNFVQIILEGNCIKTWLSQTADIRLFYTELRKINNMKL